MSAANLCELEVMERNGLRVEMLPVGPPPEAALALRARVFRHGLADDLDAQDALCHHLLICEDGEAVATCRLRMFAAGAPLTDSYSAQFYDLTALAPFAGPCLEIGRFCLAPLVTNPDILRLAWGGIARALLANDVGFLLGCSSFQGADPARHHAALAQLAAGHLSPQAIWPKAGWERFDLIGLQVPKDAQAEVPPLLRSYLAMGAWVSHAAVVDRALDTMHVFTGLDLLRVPPARLRLLQGLAQARI